MTNVNISDTVLCNAQYTNTLNHLHIDDILPIAKRLENSDFHSLQVMNSKIFKSCLTCLGEDPWERIQILKAALPNTMLQINLDGQSLLGNKLFSDEIIKEFIRISIENGIDIIRISDAQNILGNITKAISSTLKYNAHAQACITYHSTSENTNDYILQLARKLEAFGACSICIISNDKLLPYEAYKIIKKLKLEISIPIHLSVTHDIDVSSMTALKAVEAGIDCVDTILRLSINKSNPKTASLVKSLNGSGNSTSIDIDKIIELESYLGNIVQKYDYIDIYNSNIEETSTNSYTDIKQYRNDIKEYLEKEEDVLTYAMFPNAALSYFRYRRSQRYNIDPTLYNEEDKVHPV